MRPKQMKTLPVESVEDIDREQIAAMREPERIVPAARLCRISPRTIHRWVKERRVTKVGGRVDVAQVRLCVDDLYNIPRRGPRPAAGQMTLRLGKTKEPQKRLSDADRIAIIGQHIVKLKDDWAFVQLADYVLLRAKAVVTPAPTPPA
jgi:hypothetical protein